MVRLRDYIEKKIMGSSGVIDRETYLKLLELMGVSLENVDFGLDEELKFLRSIRNKVKKRVDSY